MCMLKYSLFVLTIDQKPSTQGVSQDTRSARTLLVTLFIISTCLAVIAGGIAIYCLTQIRGSHIKIQKLIHIYTQPQMKCNMNSLASPLTKGKGQVTLVR